MSDLREAFDEIFKEDPPSSAAADQAANLFGRQIALSSVRCAKLILLVVVLLVGAFEGLLWWVTRTASQFMVTSQAASVKLLDQMDVVCPPETTKKKHPWGKAGWMVFCERNVRLHGPWLAAENGRLEIRGQYEAGQQSGVWEWYDDEGNVAKKGRATFAGGD